ncbi:hypothetical protein [Armatimonas sp.]|uniref:hypothetical protein n=1 Tax=Armatimonas sp. TaxID=1872638 RepID=UPI003751A9F3
MAYSKFKLGQVLDTFDITLIEGVDLFPDVAPAEPSELLTAVLKRGIPLAEAISTEKARSEFVLAPLLAEVRERMEGRISLFSGVDFTVDAARGLNGECDFLLSRSPLQSVLRAPAFAIVEAKNLSLAPGLGQCIAEMIAAQIFNENAGKPLPCIWGAVTTGLSWRFLKLEGQMVTMDHLERSLNGVAGILGILLYIAEGN